MSVSIDLDKPRTIRFTLGAIRDLEKAMANEPLPAIMQRISQGGADAIVTSLWAGLKHEDPTLTIPKTERIVERFLDDHPVTVVAGALSDAFMASGLFKHILKDDEEDKPKLPGNAPAEPAAS